MTEKILFVDDEENILSAFRRQLRKQYSMETASNGQEGLDRIYALGPFAVVVADLRMPGMDGVQFLKKVKEIAPETVRIMLTGHADINVAMSAVNDGNIFRFLTKPCPAEELTKAIENGLQQYRLITAERDLLEKTLKISVKLLVEVLSLANPAAFNRTLRLRRIVREISSKLKLFDAWEYETAAMLSQIGCVALPPAIVKKFSSGETLTESEARTFSTHPLIGYRLLNDIHRMESVSEMVRDQNKDYCDYEVTIRTPSMRRVCLGAQILRIALDYDCLEQTGMPHEQIVKTLQSGTGKYHPDLLKALEQGKIAAEMKVAKLVDVRRLDVGMLLDEDIYTNNGELLASRFQEVTQTLKERLQIVSEGIGIMEPFQVLVPA